MKRGLIDQVEFDAWAGNGGRGIVSWRREKYIRKGGPDGGDGGNGGSVYLHANPHLVTLLDYAGKDRYEADYGEAGRGQKQHGKDADHLTLEVPVGTVVFEKKTVEGEDEETWIKLFDLDKADERVLLAQGGAGGRGNTAFKSSVNTTPMESEPGGWGERKHVRLELKVLADVGLVGLPNAGKSTLLSVLTAAKPEIANYPFTTVSPNLGVMEGKQNLVIADIPGLIENAHQGKGLGIQFLRHIERCKMLLYVVSPMDEDLAENLDEKQLAERMWNQFEVVRGEVSSYGEKVDEKKVMVIINKIDILPQEYSEAIKRVFAKHKVKLHFVSAATLSGIEELKELLVEEFID